MKAEIKVKRKVLVLHGDRQTGDLLVSRMASLKRKLLKPREHDDGNPRSSSKKSGNPNKNKNKNKIESEQSGEFMIEMMAPDGPFEWQFDPSVHVKRSETTEEEERENALMRTWWNRHGNEYGGLTDSLEMLLDVWNGDEGFEGIIGFSRGGRLAHLIATLHQASKGKLFKSLKYVVIASGYGHVPMPENFPPKGGIWDVFLEGNGYSDNNLVPLEIPSLHIMGSKDRLVTVENSRALLLSYVDPQVLEHDGGHHVPMRAANVRTILKFIDSVSSRVEKIVVKQKKNGGTCSKNSVNDVSAQVPQMPDEEHAQTQREECDSLAVIFPDEFQLLSPTNGSTVNDFGEEQVDYKFPISYAIQLKPPREQLDGDPDSAELWPIRDIALKVEYTVEYPDCLPIFSFKHDMNLLEFKLCQEDSCLQTVKEVAEAELGMACIMSCVLKIKDFFEEGGLKSAFETRGRANLQNGKKVNEPILDDVDDSKVPSSMLKPASKDRIATCIEEGLSIAYSILGHKALNCDDLGLCREDGDVGGKGGSWIYKIGLVGKPSAGKSTFFNAASGFARQRGGDEVDEDGIAIGGATMAPHPFTTIDPNIGFCLVPAPPGSCPEDDDNSLSNVACTHGRDCYGRRLLPVILKDVAGLVPGAYQGRGRGNKFLDDLTDADVLIHVVDSSGSADAEGNTIVAAGSEEKNNIGSNPMDDLDWIFNELIQWVFFNVTAKWDVVVRKGRDKLAGMFSGYKQSQSFVCNVFLAVEKHLYKHEGRDHALDHLHCWDEGDVYRLVSTFLGSRFPVALALNKNDVPSSKRNCNDIIASLPLHGAHTGTPMSAHKEMNFVKEHIYSVLAPATARLTCETGTAPRGVWNCLQSAINLRRPVLVFPVSDMETLEPISTLTELAMNSSSLPNAGMIACLNASGGSPPSLWDETSSTYIYDADEQKQVLRDSLVLKPGSTVEDAFSTLKGLSILAGEFVRAEAIGNIGEKPKLVKKDDKLGKHNRILKIMTTKRRDWQKRI